MPHIVVLNEEGEPTSVEHCHDYVLVVWQADGQVNTNVRVRQSDPKNLGHLELAARLLSRAMKASGSPLYAMIGQVVESAVDKTIENVQKAEPEK